MKLLICFSFNLKSTVYHLVSIMADNVWFGYIEAVQILFVLNIVYHNAVHKFPKFRLRFNEMNWYSHFFSPGICLPHFHLRNLRLSWNMEVHKNHLKYLPSCQSQIEFLPFISLRWSWRTPVLQKLFVMALTCPTLMKLVWQVSFLHSTTIYSLSVWQVAHSSVFPFRERMTPHCPCKRNEKFKYCQIFKILIVLLFCLSHNI